MTALERVRAYPDAPASYVRFVERAKRFVEAKGLTWDMTMDEWGVVAPQHAWDLRKLNASHAVNASWLGTFEVVSSARALALSHGWHGATLADGEVLPPTARDFIKAVVVQQCRDGRLPRDVRHRARLYRIVCSLFAKPPWCLSSEDFERVSALPLSDSQAPRRFRSLVGLINQYKLSVACPLLAPELGKARIHKETDVNARKNAHRLPAAEAFAELCRIIFTENPRHFLDHLRFLLFQVLVFTGLRLNEVLLLPADCLRIEKHVDCVTGRTAGEVGGVSTSVQLRYFVLKRKEGAPDVLVEETQWVPEIFSEALITAVKTTRSITARLRALLKVQHQNPSEHQKSDLRVFRTIDGKTIATSDLLFLMPKGRTELAERLRRTTAVSLPSLAAVYSAVGISGPLRYSIFSRYAKAAETSQLTIKPHGLRHLLDGELFRLDVSDTVITQHFGRSSVAQGYEYDHRTLAERLKFVSVPEGAKGLVEPGTVQESVVKLVASGLADESSLVRTFRSIQSSQGDDAAFRYLVANCDGFHTTPYGFCTTSFAVNPCPKHLQCFNDCSQYVPSGLEVHRISLEQLREQLVAAKQKAESRPVKSVGRRNQVEHATKLIAAVEASLSAAPDTPLFPEGVDYSRGPRDLLS